MLRNAASKAVGVGAQNPPIRVLPSMFLILALAFLLLSACAGKGGQDSAKGDNPLVGTWRRERTCDEYVRELKRAGLAAMIPAHQELVAEFGTGRNGAQSHQGTDDPCQGVNGRLPHDHVFYEDGRFASLNQNGEFVR